MLTLADIMLVVNSKLESKFKLKIYGNEVKEGFTRPSFFVQLLPTSSNLETVNLTSHSVTVVITHFTKEHDDPANLKIVDELRRLFVGKLQVKDRHLDISNFKVDFAGEDNFPQASFDLHYYDDADKLPDEHELATELIIKEVI